jgi:hypothetical protein
MYTVPPATPTRTPEGGPLHPAILQAAIQAQATHLLTADKRHFGPHFGRRLGGVLVLPPAEYFERRRKGKKP